MRKNTLYKYLILNIEMSELATTDYTYEKSKEESKEKYLKERREHLLTFRRQRE